MMCLQSEDGHLNSRLDRCFLFRSALLLPASLSWFSPATTLQTHPAVEKEVSRAIFTAASLLQTCTNRQTCIDTHTHTGPVNSTAGTYHTLLTPLSLGKPIPAVLCCCYVTQSSSRTKTKEPPSSWKKDESKSPIIPTMTHHSLFQ